NWKFVARKSGNTRRAKVNNRSLRSQWDTRRFRRLVHQLQTYFPILPSPPSCCGSAFVECCVFAEVKQVCQILVGAQDALYARLEFDEIVALALNAN
ncbi:MAG: hypothetical protein ACK52S_01070, partial [Pirellula sp.]